MSEEKMMITESEAQEELKKGYKKAEKLLKDEDKLEKTLKKLEEKLKNFPVLGDKFAKVPIMVSMVRSYIKKEYTEVPIGIIVAIVSAVIYIVNPGDIIPDIIPGVGHIDDAFVVAACLKLVESDIDEYAEWKEKIKNRWRCIMEETEVKEEKKEGLIKKVSKLFSKMPKIIKIVLIVVAILLIVILGVLFPNKMKHREIVLEFGFKDVGELVTQEWYGRILEDSSKDRKIFNKFSVPFTESRIIFSLDVEVTAGLDFTEIEWKQKDENTIIIKLPKAEIYKYYQVPNTFNSYLDDESWFTNIGSQERHGLEDAVVEKGKQTALDAGLLEKANKNAKIIIEQMVKAKNKDLKIEWEYKE